MSAHEAPAPLRLVVPPSPAAMNFLLKVYAVENTELAGGSSATLDDYIIQVRNVQKFFNLEALDRNELAREFTISDINDSLLAGCMAWMKKRGRAAATCNKLRRAIMAIHKFAIRNKKLPGEPLTVGKYPELKRKPQAWRPEQIGKLLAAAEAMPPVKLPRSRRAKGERCEWTGKHDLALILFLLNTGTRITAAMLTPSSELELDGDPPMVKVPAEIQKHGADETFDLLPITAEALRAIQPHRHKRIFDAWPFDRSQRQWPAITKRLKKMLVAAGLFPSVKDVPKYVHGFHKFRKCFATFMRAKHGKAAAKEMCGHSDESVTDRYIDVTQTGDRPSCNAALADKIQLAAPPPPPPKPDPPPPPPKPDPQRRLFD
jgi:integrase